MHELSSADQPENPKKIEVAKLSFAELEKLSKEVSELAKISFRKTANGFKNINGDVVTIIEDGTIYKIAQISDDLRNFDRYVIHGPSKILNKGSDDKEKMMQALREMIEQTGGRIIE